MFIKRKLSRVCELKDVCVRVCGDCICVIISGDTTDKELLTFKMTYLMQILEHPNKITEKYKDICVHMCVCMYICMYVYMCVYTKKVCGFTVKS